jgi:hypothetical protein
MDPDCFLSFNDIYCSDRLDEAGDPDAIPRQEGVTCEPTSDGVSCKDNICPQLPIMAPKQLARNLRFGNPPRAWTCAPELWYQLDGDDPGSADCDCGCGVVDPDCGYVLPSCSEQRWEPEYKRLMCDGVESLPEDGKYCRLESGTCQTLPPGLTGSTTEKWTCIPDVYDELSDPQTSLNDCDCNCGGMDPDCALPFNDIYCSDRLNSEGDPEAIPRESGLTCEPTPQGLACLNSPDSRGLLSITEGQFKPSSNISHRRLLAVTEEQFEVDALNISLRSDNFRFLCEMDEFYMQPMLSISIAAYNQHSSMLVENQEQLQ